MISTHTNDMNIRETRINKARSRTLVTVSSNYGKRLKKHIVLKEKNESLQWILVFKKRAPETIDIAVTLAAPGSSVDIGFAWHGTKKMTSDIALTVLHEAPKTASLVTCKAVLEGVSKINFRGLVHIAKKASASRAHLFAHGLMLSPRAIAFLKPDLEVATSEAIAGHGSSVGRPSDKDMFYFASRGITEAQTKKTLRDAFMKDILNRVQ